MAAYRLPSKTSSAKSAGTVALPAAGLVDLEPGDRICRPDGTGWSAAPNRTVLIVRSATCAACSADGAAEERLYERCRAARIPVAYVLPKREDQEAQAKELASAGRDVIRMDLPDLGITRTPSIVSIDSAGIIKALWIGTIPETGANALTDELLFGASAPFYQRVDRTTAAQVAAQDPEYQVLAFREPDSPSLPRAKYRIIPSSEFIVRAKYELKPNHLVFIDCDAIRSPIACQNAALQLSKSGFTRLAVIDLPRRGASASCQR